LLRIITANVNGIRSASQKGFLDWMMRQDADFVCVQELKARAEDMTDELKKSPQLHFFAHYAEKKGYSGVAVYTRHKPQSVQIGFGSKEFDSEGRCVCLEYPDYYIVCAYFPSGTSSEERQAAKYRFLDEFRPFLESLRAKKETVLCGDVNIAHKEIDIKNWKGNLKNSGFLPEERSWLTRLFLDGAWNDIFRCLCQEPDRYTWWSNRGQARAKNVGWRIDYQIATPVFAQAARRTDIYTGERFSDHAPLTVDYDLPTPKDAS
jgi:exodeoxyribonuclease-3